MINIMNKVLLPSDKFIPEMHLKQHRFTSGTCGALTEKNKNKYQNLKKQEILDIFIKIM